MDPQIASGVYTSSREVKGRMQNFDHIVWRKAGVEEEPRLLDEVTDVGFLQVQYRTEHTLNQRCPRL